MSESTDVWDYVCNRRPYFRAVFLFGLLLLVATVFSLFFAEAGTASYTIAIVDLLLSVVLVVSTGVALRKCARRDIS